MNYNNVKFDMLFHLLQNDLCDGKSAITEGFKSRNDVLDGLNYYHGDNTEITKKQYS